MLEVPKWADPESVKLFLEKGKGLIGITPLGVTNKVAVPGVIQFVPAGAMAKGGTWTGVMILTYMFALMGIHSSPAFSMWAFANKNPKPFPLQQVWASTLGIGFALIIFTTLQCMGGWVLTFLPGAHGTATVLPLDKLISSGGNDLVPYLIQLMKDTAPFAVGILAICALAAMQSTGAAYMSTASGMLTRDIVKRYFKKDMTETEQTHWGRITVIIVVGSALIFCHLCAGRHRDARRICDVFRVYDVRAPDRHALLALADAPGGGRRPDLRHVRGVPDLQVRSRTSLGLQSADDFFCGLGHPVQPAGRHPGEFLYPAG